MKLDEFKDDKMKTIDYLYIEISTITQKKTCSYSEQPSADFIKWTLLKPHDKYSNTSKLTKKIVLPEL